MGGIRNIRMDIQLMPGYGATPAPAAVFNFPGQQVGQLSRSPGINRIGIINTNKTVMVTSKDLNDYLYQTSDAIVNNI